MRGDGRIFLRGTTYWASFYLNGKEHRESTKTCDEKEAKKYLRRKLHEVDADRRGLASFVTAKANHLTCGDLLESLRTNFQTRGKLSAPNASNIKRAIEDFGEHRATLLTAKQVEDYANERLAQGDAKASINRTTQMLSQAFRLAVKRGELNKVPHFTRLDESDNVREGYFTETEFRAVASRLPEHLKDFCLFAYCTGMRSNEIKSLAWKDVSGDVLKLRAENAKTNKARIIPMAGELAGLLERRRAARQVDVNGAATLASLIFHHNGKRIGDFRKCWASACIAANVGRMICTECKREGTARKCPVCKTQTKYVGRIFHDFRRTFCKNATDAGVPQSVSMKLSGHRTNATFFRYALTADDQLREALTRTEQYRQAASGGTVVSINR